MVPTFGLFDFAPERKAKANAADGEREAYLAEVHTFSTEFGAKAGSEADLHAQARVSMAFLLNRF